MVEHLDKGEADETLRQLQLQNPDKKLEVKEYLLNPENSVLFVPGGYANGAMNLTKENEIRYFSSTTLKESSKDDYRIDAKFWDPWTVHNPNFYE